MLRHITSAIYALTTLQRITAKTLSICDRQTLISCG